MAHNKPSTPRTGRGTFHPGGHCDCSPPKKLFLIPLVLFLGCAPSPEPYVADHDVTRRMFRQILLHKASPRADDALEYLADQKPQSPMGRSYSCVSKNVDRILDGKEPKDCQ